MAKCGNCGHEKHLHVLGIGKCKAEWCDCWSFSKMWKTFLHKIGK